MSEWYTLVGKTPVLVEDYLSAPRLTIEQRRVAYDKVGDVSISTVFLQLDHSFGGDVPILFETMVFGGELDQECERYTTWELAEVGHRQMVQKVKDTQSEAQP